MLIRFTENGLQLRSLAAADEISECKDVKFIHHSNRRRFKGEMLINVLLYRNYHICSSTHENREKKQEELKFIL